MFTVPLRRDAEAARVLRDVYRLGSSYSSAHSGLVDLSDTTVSRLTSKRDIMRDLKVRAGHRGGLALAFGWFQQDLSAVSRRCLYALLPQV
jgi:hypothetical protein